MATQTEVRKPYILFEETHEPDWWYMKGRDLALGGKVVPGSRLILQSKSAHLEIRIDDSAGSRWVITWEIKQSQREKVSGTIIVELRTLQLMFGFGWSLDDHAEFMKLVGWMKEKKYRADVGYPGQFIRKGRYLNIPGPGTGHAGDTNISIAIDEWLQDAVYELIKPCL